MEGATDDADRVRRVKRAIFNAAVSVGRPGGGIKFGPRKNELLPYLVVRANPGDHGDRPLSGPFWESPDIFIQPNQEASTASALPPSLGEFAQAGRPNTLWAHVWNLGLSPAYNVRVEFYWFDPTVGFNADAANLIGVAHVNLGNRYSRSAHTIVKCPTSWVAQFRNGGHECLVVRCFDPLMDPLGPESWNARADRHIGQRNIHVVDASSPAELQMALRLGCAAAPSRASLEVVSERLANVPWMGILARQRGGAYREPKTVSEAIGVTRPVVHGSDLSAPDLRGVPSEYARRLVFPRVDFERKCDELAASIFVRVEGLEKGESRAFRILQRVDGELVGGYTIIARKPA